MKISVKNRYLTFNTGIWISVLRTAIEYQFLVPDLYNTEKLIY